MFRGETGQPLTNLKFLQRTIEEQHEVVTELNKRTITLAEENAAFQEIAGLDPLTGVSNRRRLLGEGGTRDGVCQVEIRRAMRSNSPLTVVMADLNYFKGINDTYGCFNADQALIKTARRFCDSLRDTDTVGRYGGDEFLCILPETPLEGALNASLKIAEVFKDPVVLSDGTLMPLAITLGIAELDPEVREDLFASQAKVSKKILDQLAYDTIGRAYDVINAAKQDRRNNGNNGTVIGYNLKGEVQFYSPQELSRRLESGLLL